MSELDNTASIINKIESLIKDFTYKELTILNKMTVDRLKLMQKADALMSMSKINVGDRVSWSGNDGMVMIGIVVKLNQKTVSVKTSADSYWNVSPQLLNKES